MVVDRAATVRGVVVALRTRGHDDPNQDAPSGVLDGRNEGVAGKGRAGPLRLGPPRWNPQNRRAGRRDVAATGGPVLGRNTARRRVPAVELRR